MSIFSDFVDSLNKVKYGEPKLTSHLDADVIDSINDGELVNLDVRDSIFLAPGEKCHYADDAYKYNGKKGFMNYDYIIGTLFITNRRIILSAPGGFDYPLYNLTSAKEYDDGILFQFGENLIAMGIATSRQAYKVIQMLKKLQ
ncbi:MAG: hypothetical protein J5744_08970 [Oscillospiraceae bacterium]|nr:hypothetical protein [Oscillospiraceae bacterium]